jgi:N-acetylglucosaminyldiphosphoundecaprenol N-acetyl-beta-D-mannosaminyltransferase
MTSDLANNPVWVWGLPLSPFSVAETNEIIDQLVEKRQCAYFITANTHYAMLTREHPELHAVNARAAFLVADGAPLVWASRRGPAPLPERVAGSDLIYTLSDLAARRGYRVFFAGGAPGVAERAAQRLSARYPALQVAGTASPHFRDLSTDDYDRLKRQIAEAQTDILVLAATMPLGEQWLSANLGDLGVPLGVNLGAAIDFAAGRVNRAPRWMQKIGLEWAFRLLLEPRRLFSRYARNAWFLVNMALRDKGQPPPCAPAPSSAPSSTIPTTRKATR